MPIVVQPKVGQAYRMDSMDHGLRIAQVDFTWTSNVPGADYETTTAPPSNSGGFNLHAIAAKLGYRRIFAVLAASVRTVNNLDRQMPYWVNLSPNVNPPVVRLHFYKSSSNLTEAVAGTDLFATDICEVVLLGV